MRTFNPHFPKDIHLSTVLAATCETYISHTNYCAAHCLRAFLNLLRKDLGHSKPVIFTP